MKIIKYVLATMTLVHLGACQSDAPADVSQEEEIQILNPYTEDGVDSSIVAKMGHLSFTDTVHDFGTLTEGQVVEWDAEYTNTGKGSIVIQYAKSTCGCTVPEHDREPIAPGQSGSMQISFNSTGKSGAVTKEVTVETSGFPNTYILTIKANVIASNNPTPNNNL